MRSSEAVTKQKKAGGHQRRRKALITAPDATDIRLIAKLLEDEGVKAFTVEDLLVPGGSLEEMVEDAIGRADMVIAVLPEEVEMTGTGTLESSRENVFVELGFALACKKPILIVADRTIELPLLAAKIPYLRTDFIDEDSLRFGLSQFLAAPHVKKEAGRTNSAQTCPIGKDADSLLARLPLSEKHASEADLDDAIAEAIQLSGVSTLVRNSQVGGARVDMAVWSDDLEPWISNPLLVEVRRTLRGKGDLDVITNRFRKAAAPRLPGWALVIYGEASPDARLGRVKDLNPTILFISARDFLESLRDHGFADVVLRLRNDRVHGRG